MANDPLKTDLNPAPCIIGDLILDLLVQEDEELSNKVTQFPIEDGSPASDHVILEPTTLTIVGMVTNAPIASYNRPVENQARVTVKDKDKLVGEEINFAELALAYLRKIMADKTLITVSTKRGVWKNMMVQRVSRSKSKATGDSLVFTITLIEIKKVKLVYVAAPRKKTTSQRAQPKTDSGKKALDEKKVEEHKSLGYNLKKGIEGAIKSFMEKT